MGILGLFYDTYNKGGEKGRGRKLLRDKGHRGTTDTEGQRTLTPLLFAFVVGGLGFEFCVFVADWRHALRSEWPFIIIIIITVLR